MKRLPDVSESGQRITAIRSSKIQTEITDTDVNRLRPTERAINKGVILNE